MRHGLAVLALMAVAGCIERAGSGDAPAETTIEAGRYLNVYFLSGHDEPPTGGQIVACDAASGLCVAEGTGALFGLSRGPAAWRYETELARFTLNVDGSGRMEAKASDYEIGVSWLTYRP